MQNTVFNYERTLANCQAYKIVITSHFLIIIYVVYEWSLSRLSFLMFSTVIEDVWFSSKIIWQVLLALLRSEL